MLIHYIRVAAAAMAVLLLPGFAMEALITSSRSTRVNLATTIGLSVSSVPLAALLFSTLGLEVSGALVVGAYSLCLLLITVKYMTSFDRVTPPTRLRRHFRSAIVALIFVGVLALRFVQIRELVLPAWVDSLHHTLIVQAIRAQGRIPKSIASYASIPFYYHFGFHTLAAVFGELADLPSSQAILILGQILNAVIVLCVDRLAMALTQRSEVGIGAALLTGFVSQMPAYYASWGRYTLLTGMILLPISTSLAVETWRSPASLVRGVKLAVLLAGLVLTHYLAAAYYFCFLVAMLVVGILGSEIGHWRHRVVTVLAWSALGILIVGPWILRILPHILPFVRIQTIGNSVSSSYGPSPDRIEYLWYLMNRPRSWMILALALPAAVLSTIRRDAMWMLGVWIAVLTFISNEYVYHIWPFRADLLIICLFLPLSIFGARALATLQRIVGALLSPRLPPSWTGGFLLIILCVWGSLDTLTIINPVTVLATEEDIKALHWIKRHTPTSARFLINVTPWSKMIYRGTDGGWWIPLLSDRETVLPPGIFYGWGSKHYILEVKQTAKAVEEIDGCTPALWDVVRDHDISHIYIGAKGGLLQPRWFDRCDGVRRVYMGYNVHVYEVDPIAAEDLVDSARRPQLRTRFSPDADSSCSIAAARESLEPVYAERDRNTYRRIHRNEATLPASAHTNVVERKKATKPILAPLKEPSHGDIAIIWDVSGERRRWMRLRHRESVSLAKDKREAPSWAPFSAVSVR